MRLWLPLLLSYAAYACPLHNLTTACEKNASAPHEWPYFECCQKYKELNESVWCGPDVRNSSGLEALNAWSGDGYGAYRVADECGAALQRFQRCSCCNEEQRSTQRLTRHLVL